jgi:hypothetical protein
MCIRLSFFRNFTGKTDRLVLNKLLGTYQITIIFLLLLSRPLSGHVFDYKNKQTTNHPNNSCICSVKQRGQTKA